MSKKAWFLGLIGLVLCVMASTAFGVEPIKIGVIGPMAYMQGENQWKGAMMAMEEINAEGGILVGKTKRPIKLFKADSNELRSVPDAASAMERLMSVNKVDFVTGGFRTEAVKVEMEIAMDNKKIFLGAGSAVPSEVVHTNYKRYKYYFHPGNCSRFDIGKLLLEHVKYVKDTLCEELGIKNVKAARLIEKAAWCEGFIPMTNAAFPKMGIEIVGTWRPSPMATDLTSELTAIKDSGAQIIFLVSSATMGVTFGRQYGELEVPAVQVGCNAEAYKPEFMKTTAGKGDYISTYSFWARVPASGSPKSIPFWDKYMKQHNSFPSFNCNTYDAIFILKEAIERAGTLDKDVLVSELEKTDTFGVQGRIQFYPKEAEKSTHYLKWGPGLVTYYLVQWQNGELKCVWPWKWRGVTHEGTVKYKVPPRVIKYWKAKLGS